LDPGNHADETWSLSLFLGARLWRGADAYVNPELLQGFGFSDTTGIAGFPNGEAFKVGSREPLAKISRLFLRQTFALGGSTERLKGSENQVAVQRPVDRLTLMIGKYAVVDVFDDNRYAHDTRSGFMNWTIDDMGAFDMASPAFNYTYGASAELYVGRWAGRAGFFLEPISPNAIAIDTSFRQFQPLVELEKSHEPFGRPGKVRVLLFARHVDAGSFSDALAAALGTGQPPSTAAVRNGLVWSYGAGLNVEQEVAPQLGIFSRAGLQSGKYEEFSFTQVQESVSGGLVLGGARWNRNDDAIGLGFVVNGIFSPERTYLAAGGTGIIIGDGALTYAPEEIVELYYKLVPWMWASITPDIRFVNHPAYNQDRGPVWVFGARLRGEY
jgi:high affinity Mn2+ porin